jgi:hypothetical protein
MQQIWVKVEGNLYYNSLIYSLKGNAGKQLTALCEGMHLFTPPVAQAICQTL